MAANTFVCRQCSQVNELTSNEIEGRKSSPWTRTCTCGARYQITKTEIRLIAWSPGYQQNLRMVDDNEVARHERLEKRGMRLALCGLVTNEPGSAKNPPEPLPKLPALPPLFMLQSLPPLPPAALPPLPPLRK